MTKKTYKLVHFNWKEIPSFAEIDISIDIYERLDHFENEYGLSSICCRILNNSSILHEDNMFKKTVLDNHYSGCCVVVDETKYGLFLLEHSDKIHKVEVVEYEV